ncbi:MAG: GNAT family N-acetyltransferase [Methylobacteriaceae bacterium]|nr:GNAT family N-acetyltransferase [Methylobacteriaceae bacterium]
MIKGKRVALTELRRADSPLLFEWINDPETVRFNAAYAPVHEPVHENWFETISRDASRVAFALRDAESSQLVGILQLTDFHQIHRSVQLIIRIGRESDRGRGYGGEAVRLAAQYAFRDRNVQRLWLTVFGDNARAMRAYEKAGLKVEGVLRRAYYIDGRWRDGVIMAALADEAGELHGHG